MLCRHRYIYLRCSAIWTRQFFVLMLCNWCPKFKSFAIHWKLNFKCLWATVKNSFFFFYFLQKFRLLNLTTLTFNFLISLTLIIHQIYRSRRKFVSTRSILDDLLSGENMWKHWNSSIFYDLKQFYLLLFYK